VVYFDFRTTFLIPNAHASQRIAFEVKASGTNKVDCLNVKNIWQPGTDHAQQSIN